jgi:xanthine dehydrogenase YagR molybdenum-binding subunit
VELIGAPLDRVDGHLKVTGRAAYAADVSLPRMAHAVMVLSTVPSGRITAIDSAAAANMPGVLAVLSHLNAPSLPQKGKAGVNPPAGRILSLLQDDEVHYNRQPIAVVVADTLDQAGAAAARILISYQNQAAQLNFAQARRSAHAPAGVNQEPTDSERGGSDFGEVAAQVQATYTTPMEHHNPMEPHATVAHWRGDHLTLYDSTQYISGCRNTIAKIFGIEKENIRVICPYVGGGFGCKGSTWSHVPLAAMAARQVGRPVKLVIERPQMFGPVGGRPQTEQRVMIAANSRGEFVGMQHDSFSHTSMIEDFTEPAAVQTRILYSCPNLKTSHRLVQLNVATPTFQRAPGHATGTFALESAIDELAYKLALDPIDLRLRNEPQQDPDKQLPWSLRSLRECYASGAQAFGWSRRTPAPGSMRDGRNLLGWGMATATYPANRQPANASARLLPDGTVVVQSGTQDLGTGTYTIMTQIAAQTLGFPLHRVRFELGDSLLPEAPVSGGSMSAASVGPAVQAAAQALREKLIELAIGDDGSPVFGATADGIVIDGGSIGLRSKDRREPITATLARRGGRPIEVFSSAKAGEEKKQRSMHSFGAVFAEVHIDPDLRIIRVPRIVARYDIGRLLNAKTGRSQLMGGVVWGIGMALMEQSVLDERNGRLVNANLAEYHVPTNADIGSIDVDVIGESDPYINPLGARGIGEIGITGIAAALANAVYHATAVRVRDLPITLDKILLGEASA